MSALLLGGPQHAWRAQEQRGGETWSWWSGVVEEVVSSAGKQSCVE